MPKHRLWESHSIIGLTLFCVCLDILHVVDLGVASYYLGSCIWVMVHHSGLVGNFEERVDTVWAMLVKAYALNGTNHSERIDRCTFSSVFGSQTGPKPSDYPQLRGKAAQNRWCAPALVMVARTLHEEQGLHDAAHKHQLDGLELLVQFYECVYPHGHFLPAEEQKRVMETVDEFLLKQNWLSVHYMRTGPYLFHVTFKSHLLWHVANNAQWYNPRSGWTYRDESFMGLVARVAASMARGRGSLRIGRALAQKWRRLQWFRLRRREGRVFRRAE